MSHNLSIPSRADAARAVIEEGARVLAFLNNLEERFGKDRNDGAVIRFQTVHHTGTLLTYAAIRAAGLWYSTGATGLNAADWESFMIWMDHMDAFNFETISEG